MKAIKDFGLHEDPKLVVECRYVRQNAYKATKRFMANKNHPTAFFAQDDNMAIGVREAILSEKLRIPEDVALIGVDNIQMTSLMGVDLTTITQNIHQMGSTGTETLTRKIEGGGLSYGEPGYYGAQTDTPEVLWLSPERICAVTNGIIIYREKMKHCTITLC